MLGKKKKALKKNMAILACLALVSLVLPDFSYATDSSSKETPDPTTSSSWLERNLLISIVSADPLLDVLASSNQDPSSPRNVQGNSTSKKTPNSGD